MALALSLGCQFVTADERFYKALETTKLKKHLLWVGDI
jgi:predicted nucleic acid-binding protein